jgi:Tol biopolymer transport system component
MGEVYRARDTKLDRDVAVKVLPPAVAQDPERLTRFEREAKSLATLNHPHIAQIYAVEQGAIVMELVPGETLRGPLPIVTALEYARQIASALEAAHEKGIVHRDLKPGNVMVTPEGVVKVLDFGLAGRAAETTSRDLSLSPTLTVQATQTGVIIGTAAYMSPEQASGKPVDKRADIWSFGVILWELLTGTRLFDGETVSHTLADVLRAPIDIAKLPPSTPAPIRQLLARCVDRDVKNRLRDIGEARVAIEKYLAGPKMADAGRDVMPEPRGGNRPAALAWGVATLAMAAAAALAFIHFREQPPAAAIVRFVVHPPRDTPFVNSVVLSPDGRRFVFEAPAPDGRIALWVQSIDSLDARLLAGTEGAATHPFWSPDGRAIVFGVNGFPGRLRRVDANGGPPQTLCEYAAGFRGGDWNRSGDILFGAGDGLFRVPESGGPAVPVTKIDPSRRETQHSGPSFLSDDRRFLYLRVSAIPEHLGLYLGSLDVTPEAQSTTRLAIADSNPELVAEASAGLVLFLRQGTLLVQPLDDRAQLTGSATPIAEDVGSVGAAGWFSVSATGTLAYRTGRAAATASELVWFDRSGKRLGQIGPRQDIGLGGLALSSDGRRVIVSRLDESANLAGFGAPQGSHLWFAETGRGLFSRVSSGEASESAAALTPDNRVVFTSALKGAVGDLYWMPADGSGAAEPLLVKSPTVKHPNAVSPDGRFLIYDDHTVQYQDLWILPLEASPGGGERKPIPFLVTAADETFGQFSPDGKWIAYSSNESGTREVYVQGFAPDRVPAATGGKWRISSNGGDKPRWSHDGDELFYIASDRKLMAVSVKIGSTFEIGKPVSLFDTNVISFMPYDVTRDGRFLMNTLGAAPDPSASPVTMVLNWQAALTK